MQGQSHSQQHSKERHCRHAGQDSTQQVQHGSGSTVKRYSMAQQRAGWPRGTMSAQSHQPMAPWDVLVTKWDSQRLYALIEDSWAASFILPTPQA